MLKNLRKTPINTWYAMGYTLGLAITSIPKFYLERLVLLVGLRKRHPNVVLDGIGLLFYGCVGLPISFFYLVIKSLEGFFIPPLLGWVGNQLGGLVQRIFRIKLNNYSPVISHLVEDMIPKAFNVGLIGALSAIGVGGAIFSQGFLLGASLYTAYRAGIILNHAINSLIKRLAPSHTLKIIANNVRDNTNKHARLLSTMRFFKVFRRFISFDVKLTYSKPSLILTYKKTATRHFVHINKELCIKTDHQSLLPRSLTDEQTKDYLMSAFIDTLRYADNEAEPDNFTLAHLIRWLHGTNSATIVGMKEGMLIPFGHLINKFAPFGGELDRGINMNYGANHKGISGVCNLGVTSIWNKYAINLEYSALNALFALNFCLPESISKLFDAQGDTLPKIYYKDILTLLIQMKRLQQWDLQQFNAWLDSKDFALNWILSKVTSFKPVQVSHRTCINNLKHYLNTRDEDESFWNSLRKGYPQCHNYNAQKTEQYISHMKQLYRQLSDILDNLLTNRSTVLTWQEKQLALSAFPLIFASTKKSSPSSHVGHLAELIWDGKGLRLGEEIDVIITDTAYNQRQIEAILEQKDIKGVKCITYASYIQALDVLPCPLEELFAERLYKEASYPIFTLSEQEVDELFEHKYASQWQPLRASKSQATRDKECEEKVFREEVKRAMKNAFCGA